jgi:prophage maintenance system killer protein
MTIINIIVQVEIIIRTKFYKKGCVLMEEKRNEIILFENQGVKLEVNLSEETVWLTQAQMEILFDVKHATISEHINNIFKEGELNEKTSVGISDKSTGGRKSKIYNLDVIISVGYRVKSKNGVIFRQWANKILKDYMLKGYAINQKRLDYLEKTVKLIDIANRMDERLEAGDAKEILKVIGEYSKALDLLDDYDHRTLKKINGNTDERKIEYQECINIINKLRFNEESTLFAVERNKGLDSIIGNIYQSFAGQDVYKSIEEKGANFLYLIVKNHVFTDGNKRIAATLFIYFLNFYGILYKNEKQVIDNNTLAALTLLIAESNPKEKDVIIDLVMNFLNNE